ncbi:integrin beta-PS-like [Tachypleus tridentatus]|uniref:integrin beta-PS-like n=1 Tax=Tachypleus tridentatus TaxID=6853 RepID=UPI003FD5B8A4
MKLEMYLVVWLSSVVVVVHSQVAQKLTSSHCISKKSCGECITSHPECAWCSEEDFESGGSWRCDTIGSLITKCSQSKIVHPNNKMEKLVNKQLSDKGTSEEDAVQIKPQRIKLTLKPKSLFTLNVEFRQAVDYPVDLYYLMDLSKSMEDDKDKLADLGNLLATTMENITSNFRLGFGSFVDKVVMPYVSTVPQKLKEPCRGCAPPYGFKNHMPLSLNTHEFEKQVKAARVSGNLDAPEGGFDAMMQAIVCHEAIEWRRKSRKMLVFSTDSGFHYAGDGKLGGIIKPNDGQCHLDEQGNYIMSIYQDYPSLSQINAEVKKHKVNVIFAVTSDQLSIYKRLSGHLEGSTAGKLEKDSSNVVELVKDQYNRITSSVKLQDNVNNDFIEIKYFSSCLGGKRENTNECKGLKVGDNVTFEARIEVKKCPENHTAWNQTIQIYPVGLNEALTVELHVICECMCEKSWNEEKNSDKCTNGNGTYSCGMCVCNEGRSGKKCECDSKDIDLTTDEAQCIFGNDTKPCTGRGICHCGVCECFQRQNPEETVTGRFCECDNFSCDRYEGEICSGPSHGKCECGECDCLPGWKGSACECKDSVDSCIAPDGDQTCSGHGDCKCGVCECFESEDQRYSGRYCEECPTCPGLCEDLKECVQCLMFESGPLSDEECKNCSFIPEEVSEAEVKEPEQRLCIFRDDDDCKFKFVYTLDENNNPLVWAERTKDCPEPISILAIVLGVIGGIVLVGLALLLIWKLLTTIHDRREFAKFEKERQMAKWDTGENPIYKQATTTFKNPTYGGRL